MLNLLVLSDRVFYKPLLLPMPWPFPSAISECSRRTKDTKCGLGECLHRTGNLCRILEIPAVLQGVIVFSASVLILGHPNIVTCLSYQRLPAMAINGTYNMRTYIYPSSIFLVR